MPTCACLLPCCLYGGRGGAPEVLLEGNHKLEQDGGEGGRWGEGGWREVGGGDGLEVNQTIGSRYTNPAPI